MPLFHVWFGTKFRQQALQGDVCAFVLASFRKISDDNSIDLIEADAQFDHVHLLLRASDERELSRSMMLLKGISAREVFLQEPDLRLSLRTLVFWQKSFGRREVPEEQIEKVRRYIRTQLDRPLRH